MKNEVKNSPFNVILVAVCVFVGVGFITGAEIWFYFARFGKSMVFGMITFAVLAFLLVFYSMGEDSIFPPRIRKLKSSVLFVGELLIGSAMISGILQVTRQLFGEFWWVVFFLSILVMILVFWKGLKSTIFYNYFVAIFIIFVIVCLFLFNNNNVGVFTTLSHENFSWQSAFLSSIFACVYIFMNISEIRPITEKFNHRNKLKNKLFFSLTFSLILILLVFTLSLFLILNKNIVSNSMPFLVLFNNKSLMIKMIFLSGLVLAMISTAVACLVGMEEKINLIENDKNFNKILVILLSLIFGQIPFYFFIQFVYPVVGIFNFLVFVIEIIYRSKKV